MDRYDQRTVWGWTEEGHGAGAGVWTQGLKGVVEVKEPTYDDKG